MKVLYISLFFLFILSCKQKPVKEPSLTERVKAKIDTAVISALDDPASFQFVEMGKIDTVTQADTAERRIDIDFRMIRYETDYESAKSDLQFLLDYEDKISGYKARIPAARARYIKAQKALAKDSLRQVEAVAAIPASYHNTITEYTVFYTYRAKNKFGALVKERMLVSLDPELNITEMRPFNR